MVVSASLTMAAIYGLAWPRRQDAWAHLSFALLALVVAGFAAAELWMMKAQSVVAYAQALRWLQVLVWLGVLSVAGFVQSYLRAGRPWLCIAACVLRTLSLLPNFVGAPNLNYREIVRIEQVPWLGDTVAVAVGTPNPWMLLGQLSLVLLVAFIIDASRTAWRRGERRRALVVGGGLTFFICVGAADGILVFWHVIEMPIITSPFFSIVIAAMGFELRTTRKAMEEETQRQRVELAQLSRVATLSELSGALAHELNQPLTIILSNAEAGQFLLDQDPPDLIELKAILTDIVSEDQRAADVIRRLRTLLRGWEPDLKDLDVNDLVQGVLPLLHGDLAQRGVTVDLHLSPAVPRVRADRVLLEQVLLNLIANACDAMAANPPQERRLVIATAKDAEGARITVTDTGHGLAPDPQGSRKTGPSRTVNPMMGTKTPRRRGPRPRPTLPRPMSVRPS